MAVGEEFAMKIPAYMHGVACAAMAAAFLAGFAFSRALHANQRKAMQERIFACANEISLRLQERNEFGEAELDCYLDKLEARMRTMILSEANTVDICKAQTRWQAVRIVCLEDPTLFRIDVIELTDKNPTKPDMANRCFPLGDGETKRTLDQTLHDFGKRGKGSTEESSIGEDCLIDGNLFSDEQCEGSVELWGRIISWRRYSFVAHDGGFEIRFCTKAAAIIASGTMKWNTSGLPELDNMSFRRESKGSKSKWHSWGFDIQNDLGENTNYLIVGKMSVW